jgi:hypothetical protein
VNIRRSFFIALPLGLLLSAAIYFGLFNLQLGVSTGHWAWLHEIIQKKEKAAAAITKPKLLIVAGSSALFGISAEEIERQTGYAAYNFGSNASLGPHYLLYLTRKICRPGDTVLLAFEYEQYYFGGLDGDAPDEFFIKYILGYDREYIQSLSFRMQFKLSLLTPGERFWSGLAAVFRKPKVDPAQVEIIRGALANITSYGDQKTALRELRPEHSPARTTLSYIPAYGFPPSPAGFPAIREFTAWARANHIRVLATYPNITHLPEYDLPAAKHVPAQFHALYESVGVPVLGDISESMLPEEEMNDTLYHPLYSAAIERTHRLLVHLAPYLKR